MREVDARVPILTISQEESTSQVQNIYIGAFATNFVQLSISNNQSFIIWLTYDREFLLINN